MSFYRTAAAAMAATALAAGFALPAFAQAETETPQATQPAAPTEEDLQSYAAAALEVQSLLEEWQPQIEAAESPEQANEIGQQAQAEMVMAVEAEGLSVEEYNRITQLAQTDPELQSRIMSYIESQ